MHPLFHVTIAKIHALPSKKIFKIADLIDPITWINTGRRASLGRALGNYIDHHEPNICRLGKTPNNQQLYEIVN